MIIPFEQMAADHQRDVLLTKYLTARGAWADGTHGVWMWCAATAGFNAEESEPVINLKELVTKYPINHTQWTKEKWTY